MTGQLFAIIAVGLAALGVLVAHYYRPSRRAERKVPNLGLEVFAEDCTMLDDEEEPEWQDDRPIRWTLYGTRLVHRQCMDARRDGGVACSDCARVMVGAA